MIDMPPLPYAENALEPVISTETISYHYSKHTKKYYDTMNTLIKGTTFENYTDLEHMLSKKTLQTGDSALFNNVAQAWNHTFYWNCLAPEEKVGTPSEELVKEIDREFGSMEKFKEQVIEKATKHFASGWCWIIVKNERIMIKTMPNANTPLTTPGETPLFVIDLWEHAHYIDYPADRPKYLKSIWNLLNWNFINDNYENR